MDEQPTRLQFACDTGGTFTDLVVDGLPGGLRLYKRPTTPANPVAGLLDVIGAAAEDTGISVDELLGRGELFVFGTTRATNAVVTGAVARTALLVTEGHPDMLLFGEGGGRTSLFDYTQEYPDPYVPRALTFEIPERIGADGEVVRPLDEDAAVAVVGGLRDHGVEAVAVSLLWSIVNPAHELRLGELIARHLPGVPFTLGHQLNPAIREVRRTASAAIDASLKPLMSAFFVDLEKQLVEAGFRGRLLITTSAGGALDASEVAATPIHSIGSGPASAPVAGRHFADVDADVATAVVTDAGGTTFDVSLIRDGRIPWTRETRLGHPVHGPLTGFPSIDARSIGAGGGSIAWVDEGGLLHVGPQSAGADPGPACYGRGGLAPTVTDACLLLGYLDPGFFLGGAVAIDAGFAEAALRRDVADPLGISPDAAAAAVLDLAVERMSRTIEEIALVQGIDTRDAVMVAGGGGAGLYATGIARRLGSPAVIVPEVSAALSATGALLSDVQRDFAITSVMSTAAFDLAAANALLADLEERGARFRAEAGAGAVESHFWYSVEARYPHQVWEIDVPLPVERFESVDDVDALRATFHRAHEQLFAVADTNSEIEVVAWRAHVTCTLRRVELGRGAARGAGGREQARTAIFADTGRLETPVIPLDSLVPGVRRQGPLLVESPVATVVVDPGADVERLASGSLLLRPCGDSSRSPSPRETARA